MHNESLLEFPCDFPIKVMGQRSADFHLLVADIVGRHVPDPDVGQLRYRDSRNGRYRSVTVVIQARSRAQLDALYKELSDHERVVMAL